MGNLPKCPQGGIYTIGKVGEPTNLLAGQNQTATTFCLNLFSAAAGKSDGLTIGICNFRSGSKCLLSPLTM